MFLSRAIFIVELDRVWLLEPAFVCGRLRFLAAVEAATLLHVPYRILRGRSFPVRWARSSRLRKFYGLHTTKGSCAWPASCVKKSVRARIEFGAFRDLRSTQPPKFKLLFPPSLASKPQRSTASVFEYDSIFRGHDENGQLAHPLQLPHIIVFITTPETKQKLAFCFD